VVWYYYIIDFRIQVPDKEEEYTYSDFFSAPWFNEKRGLLCSSKEGTVYHREKSRTKAYTVTG